MNLKISELKTETKNRFESIENHVMNLVKDHEDFREWNTKSKNNSERRLIEEENHHLKKKSFGTGNFLEKKVTCYKFNN